MPLRTLLKNFVNHVGDLENRRLLGDNLYEREFQKLKEITDKLKSDPTFTCRAGQLDGNRRKNRYKDILPYDRTRVVLQEINNDPYSDYINASYIKGSSGSMAYIAAQGPLPHTVNEFWRMVWQCEVQVVVMACNEREGGKNKCDYYWPSVGEGKQYGDVVIQTVKVKPICDDFLVRTWKLIRGNEHRTVCQFHYVTWPDHGIPSSVNPILHMIRLIRNCQATETIPVLVHCSAGCGRTGTFCAIDQVWGLLRTGKLKQMFSLFKMIADMRRQRIAMVQTKEQYMLVHRAVATLFQQQLLIIDSHPYQNVDKLGEPLAIKNDDHIYENIDPQLDNKLRNDDVEAKAVRKPSIKSHRLETPPSTDTDASDDSSNEYDAYKARHSNRLSSNSQKLATTLPAKHVDDRPHVTFANEVKRSHTLVKLQEEEHLKRLLAELNSVNDELNSYKRKSRVGSQDDINVTYSPERSLIYVSDSDDSGARVQPCNVKKKPGVDKLKELLDNTKMELPSPPKPRREITRSHSQRVAKSANSGTLLGSIFYVPVTKSDSFTAYRPEVMHRSNASERRRAEELSVHDDGSSAKDNLSEQQAIGRPELPKKQRNTKPKSADLCSTIFYVDGSNSDRGDDNENELVEIVKARKRSNEYTSTGTRKPPVLPRKKFIGGRNCTLAVATDSDETNCAAGVSSSYGKTNEIAPNVESNRAVANEDDVFHGSGGSIFYGSCVANAGLSKAHGRSESNAVSVAIGQKSTSYTNVSPQTKKNIEQIHSTIEQCPRGAIIDLTSTRRNADKETVLLIPEVNVKEIFPDDKKQSEFGMHAKSVDVLPAKRSKGYEPIWLTSNQTVLASSCDSVGGRSPKPICSSNYGRITPRCKSEERVLESKSNQSDPDENLVYGRIGGKAASEPPPTTESSNQSRVDSSANFQNLLIHSPLMKRKNSTARNRRNHLEPEFNQAVAEIRNLIDELMFDSTGNLIHEVPKRERCHSVELLSDEQPPYCEARERRPSTDLLDVATSDLLRLKKNKIEEINKTTQQSSLCNAPEDNALSSSCQQTPRSLFDFNMESTNQAKGRINEEKSDSRSVHRDISVPSDNGGNQTSSNIPGVDVATADNVKTWTASNWSEKLSNPSGNGYKPVSSTVLRNSSPLSKPERIYDTPADDAEVQANRTKKSRVNISRSVSAREAQRPHVVKRDAGQDKSSAVSSSATIRPYHPAGNESNNCRLTLPEKPIGRSKSPVQPFGDEHGYVTLAETAVKNYPPDALWKAVNGDKPDPVSTDAGSSPIFKDDFHQYATLTEHFVTPTSKSEHLTDCHKYRMVPPPPPRQLPQPCTAHPEEHIYCLPTLPKYRPPPPPPQQKTPTHPELPTPPPSSEETSSSSSQGETRPEPLYSQIQKPRKDPGQFCVAENLSSSGYGHILTKFSHDDLDISSKPVAPPRKGRRPHKSSRHSMLDVDCKNVNWMQDNSILENSVGQSWINQQNQPRQHEIVRAVDNSDLSEDGEVSTPPPPNIPKKTAAAYQLPNETETDVSNDSPSSSSASMNSSVGSGTNIKLDDSHGSSSLLSRSISKAFGKLNLLNRLGVKQDHQSATSEAFNSDNYLSKTSPRLTRKQNESQSGGMGFSNRINKHPKGPRPVPQNWKNHQGAAAS